MTTELWLRYDLRNGGVATSRPELYAAAVEQTAWADRRGFDAVMVGEHHGADDGYIPSPMILGAAVAARTENIRLGICSILPLTNPLRVAEDLCVLDNVSDGRVDVLAAVGYVPQEFEMFGVDMKARASLIEEAIGTLRAAFTGEPFCYHDRQVRVTPRVVQSGGPPILVGGALKTSATRAARFGDGFVPSVTSPELVDCYVTECKRLNRLPGRIISFSGSGFIQVTRDPERTWAQIGKHLLHEMNAYGKWAREGGAITAFQPDIADVEALKGTGAYFVFTPDECLAHVQRERAAGRCVMFNPLCGGLHPDLAWESLELFASEVLPRVGREHAPRP